MLARDAMRSFFSPSVLLLLAETARSLDPSPGGGDSNGHSHLPRELHTMKDLLNDQLHHRN